MQAERAAGARSPARRCLPALRPGLHVDRSGQGHGGTLRSTPRQRLRRRRSGQPSPTSSPLRQRRASPRGRSGRAGSGAAVIAAWEGWPHSEDRPSPGGPRPNSRSLEPAHRGGCPCAFVARTGLMKPAERCSPQGCPRPGRRRSYVPAGVRRRLPHGAHPLRPPTKRAGAAISRASRPCAERGVGHEALRSPADSAKPDNAEIGTESSDAPPKGSRASDDERQQTLLSDGVRDLQIHRCGLIFDLIAS